MIAFLTCLNATFFVLGLLGTWFTIGMNAPYLSRLKHVKVGATPEKVQEVLGQPQGRLMKSNDRPHEVWVYEYFDAFGCIYFSQEHTVERVALLFETELPEYEDHIRKNGTAGPDSSMN